MYAIDAQGCRDMEYGQRLRTWSPEQTGAAALYEDSEAIAKSQEDGAFLRTGGEHNLIRLSRNALVGSTDEVSERRTVDADRVGPARFQPHG